jgi:restriction system protein
MSGTEFELYVKARLEQYGYQVETTPASRDGGVDLVAVKRDELGLESTLLVQCKNWSSPAGPEVVRELNGVLPRDGRPVKGLVVCTAGFTADATRFAEKHHMLLWAAANLLTGAG